MTASAQKQIVTSKCGCDRMAQRDVWQYTRSESIEKLTSDELNTFVKIDWVNNIVETPSGIFQMYYKIEALNPRAHIFYSNLELTINYTAQGKYLFHTSEKNKKA